MQRLKDTYYTDKYLDGNISQTGIKQESPKFFQGEDIRLSFYLNYNGVPVSEQKYIIEAIVKKSPIAKNILWKGVLGNGLYKTDVNGNFYILMPAAASALFLPGAYYFDAKIMEKVGSGNDVKDLTVVVLSDMFNIELSAASPNPGLRPSKSEESSYDPETGITTVTITSVEPTLPLGTDITKP